MARSILIMAGGTGGHIFPAGGPDICGAGLVGDLVGAPHSMEAELVPKHGYDMAWVQFSVCAARFAAQINAADKSAGRTVAKRTAIFRHRPM